MSRSFIDYDCIPIQIKNKGLIFQETFGGFTGNLILRVQSLPDMR